MSEQTIAPNQTIGNVATLDLRTTSEATFAKIKRIGNVATLLYSTETAGKVTGLSLGNVATMVEAPVDAKVLLGQTILGSSAFQANVAPVSLVVSGQLIVEHSLTAEELDRGLGSLVVSGQALCPKHLAGVLQSKLTHMSGQLVVYPSDAKVIMGKLTLTEVYLRQLPAKTDMVILGKLQATEPLPSELLDQKLGQIQVYGKVICAEENSSLINNLQGQATFGEVTVVPAGFELVDRPLTLDADLLETFTARRLYCTNVVRYEEDVTPEVLESAIDKMVATQLLLAPSHLRKTLAKKCDLLQTRAIFYVGKLWVIEDEVTIDSSWFDLLEGQATLVVQGEARLDAGIAAELITSRLHRVHNLGEITATRQQLAALQAQVGLNEGEWLEDVQQEEEDDSLPTIGNVAYLKL